MSDPLRRPLHRLTSDQVVEVQAAVRAIVAARATHAATARPNPIVPYPASPDGAATAARVDAHRLPPALIVTQPGTRSTGLPREVDADIDVVVESSGSTGRRKLIGLNANALYAQAWATARRFNLAPGAHRWALALPTHYVAGLQVLIRSAIAGRAPVVIEPGMSAFDFVEATAQFAEADGSRAIALVPVQLARLVDAALDDDVVGRSLRSYDLIMVGGQAIPDSLRDRANELGLRLTRSFGTTETSGGNTYDGMPLDTTTLRIASVPDGDEAAFDAAPDQDAHPIELRSSGVGELFVSSPALALEYVGNEQMTADRFVEVEGRRWFRTGDLARIDEPSEHPLTIIGRIDVVIASGGVKLHGASLEWAAQGVAGFGEAAAYAAPDAEWGSKPVVVAELAAIAGAGGVERIAHTIVERLERVLTPEEVRVAKRVVILGVEELPRLASGKIDRLALADEVERRLSEHLNVKEN